MAAVMSVTVGGVDLTTKIIMETFTAEVGSRDTITTCSFDIRDETKTIDIKSGSVVIVTATVTISPSAPVATVVWRGYVGNIDWAFDGAANLITVDCQSANALLDQKAYRNKEANRYVNGRTRGSDIIWLLSNSTASEGASPIAYNAAKIYNAAGTWSTDLWFGGKTLREALEHFCKNAYSGKMQFWVDTSGELNISRVGKDINMIANWEFQLGTGSAATNWTYTGTPTREAIAGQNSNGAGAPISGSEIDYGLKVDSSTESAGQEISGITAGKRYYFSGAIKNLSNNRAQILLRFRASSGGAFLLPTTTITTTTVGSWVRVEQVVTAPATATHLEIRLGHSATTGGSVYYDNLQLIAETASFGISDSPNNTSTFAPMNYEESLDASAIINAVAIKGGETSKGSKKYQSYYREYAPSLAYFGRVFGSFIDDSSVTSNPTADRAADAIFSESAMPVREGTYTISSDRLGYTVPVAGTYQIFELSRMPAARQITINRIEGLSILPFGNGEIVYEIQFGSQKGNLASALATVGSALIGTGKPRLGSTAFEHNLQQSGYVASGRLLSDPQVTGAAAEVESPSPMPAANTPISIIKKNSTLTVVQNLPDLAVYADEFPEGTLVMLKPDAADPHLSAPTLFRSDGAASWAVASPATILADATDIGQFQHGIITAESIFAGTIDASVITVDNINATKIKTGALTLTPLSATAITSTNFSVSNTGEVTAKKLTLNPNTLETQGIDFNAGAITITPPTGFGAATLKITNSAGTDDYDSVGVFSATAAAANSPSTVTTDTAHNFSKGQMVSFHSVDATWNAIDASKPIQIISTPSTTTFTIEHFVILPAVASNSAGTVRAYKRLAIRAAGGLYVYRDATNAGDIAAGSLVLGNNLAAYGKDNLATVADGELAFIKAATPRYQSGANLYSSNGTTNLSTSGEMTVGGHFTTAGHVYSVALFSTYHVSEDTTNSNLILRASSGSIVVQDSNTVGTNPRITFMDKSGTSYATVKSGAANIVQILNGTSATDYAYLYAQRFYPMVGASTGRYMWDDGTRTQFTGGIGTAGSIATNGSITNDNISVTTATTNAAIWTFIGGTSYLLRRNSSSARYKTNIVDADEAVLEAARKIKPRHFESTIEDEAGETRLGFIAEEVLEAGLSHAVGFDGEGRVETLDPTALIAALFVRVNDLEARLAALENKS